MIARATPYGLAPFQAALDALVMRVSNGTASGEELKAASAQAQELFESIAAGSPPDRTPADVWTCRFDGKQLTASGPRVTALATLRSGELASLAMDFPSGSFELTLESASARVRVTDAGGAEVAHYTFGADGAVHDERVPPAAMLGVDDLFGPPPGAGVADVPPAPPATTEKQWYYVSDGKPEGPLPESELRIRLQALPLSTMVWNEDLPEWKSAADAGLGPAASPAPEAVPPKPAPVAAPAPERAAPQAPDWVLAIQGGSGSTGPYSLAGEMRIGRSPECEICLSDGMASRVHAFVRQKPDGFWIFDNQSLNGTDLNGARLGDPALLKAGDVIRVGDTELVFRAAGLTAAAAAPEQAAAPIRQDPSPYVPPRPAPVAEQPPVFAVRPTPVIVERPAPAIRPQPAAEPAAALLFCTECGGRNHGDAAFCVHCGRRLRP